MRCGVSAQKMLRCNYNQGQILLRGLNEELCPEFKDKSSTVFPTRFCRSCFGRVRSRLSTWWFF